MREEIETHTNLLASNPYLGERLSSPLAFLYSYHFTVFGKYFRAAYAVNTAEREITIYYVGPRGEFYKRLRRIFGL